MLETCVDGACQLKSDLYSDGGGGEDSGERDSGGGSGSCTVCYESTGGECEFENSGCSTGTLSDTYGAVESGGNCFEVNNTPEIGCCPDGQSCYMECSGGIPVGTCR